MNQLHNTVYRFELYLMTKLSFSDRMELAKINRFPKSSFCYILIFWECEQKYEVLPSSSTFFKTSTNARNLNPKECVELRDGSIATVIATSEDKGDIEKLQQRLESRLKSGPIEVGNDSLRFLEHTFSETQDDCATEIATEDPIPEAAANTSAIQPESLQTKLLKQIVQQQARQEKILIGIHRELKRANKAKASVSPLVDRNDNLEPVLYNDINLVECAARNASPSLFGIEAARQLWTDDEIKAGRVGIAKRRRGRPPLDLERQDVWAKACKVRFRNDTESLAEAVAAVNQLGNDLNQGKRARSA